MSEQLFEGGNDESGHFASKYWRLLTFIILSGNSEKVQDSWIFRIFFNLMEPAAKRPRVWNPAIEDKESIGTSVAPKPLYLDDNSATKKAKNGTNVETAYHNVSYYLSSFYFT